MPVFAVDVDHLAAVGDIVLHAFFFIQHHPVLVEVGDFQPGAGFNRS